MSIRARSLAIAAVFGLMLLPPPLPASAAGVPDSMAATGDSITQAYNVGWCCMDRDNPQFSWSTGDDPQVTSLYQRMLGLNPDLGGHNANLAVSGAKMAGLQNQLTAAAAAQTEFVTVQIGTNDVCVDRHDQMTPTAVFRSQYQQALTAFFAANPEGVVFQLSIPNWYQLWAVLHNNPQAQWVWDYFSICKTMLSSTNTEADRQWALYQEFEYNQALADVCNSFAGCIWDRNATFYDEFTAADISDLDWSHPSFAGQNRLAQVAWTVLLGLGPGALGPIATA
jgi:lysophospholipase L1-like esterase